MIKAFFIRKMRAVAIVVTVTTLLPLGVSAEWKQNSDRTWSYTSGNEKVKGWKCVSGTWYYFDSNGIMKTGWVHDKGSWYYLNSSGAMQTDWVKDNEKWYYMNDDGAMQIGIVNIGGKIYYFNELGEWQETQKILSQGVTSNSSDILGETLVEVNGLSELPKNYAISVQAYAENKILELMNQKRTEAGLQPLIMDNTLLQVARYKSNHMIQYNYFDHTTLQGNDWTSWLDAIGYRYTTTGENIAYNNYDSVNLFDQWWNSPGHKANMMNSSYTKVGIGVIEGNGKYMGTQTFSN